MRSLLAACSLSVCLLGCAEPTQLIVQELPHLIDSFPGNGSVVPVATDDVLLRFSAPLDITAPADDQLSLQQLDPSGEPIASLELRGCRREHEELVVRCTLPTLQQASRYRLLVGEALRFASGLTLGYEHPRWFETL